MSHKEKNIQLSVVIPVFNEEKNVAFIYNKILAALDKINITSYEIIFCDDGSTDSSVSEINKLVEKNNAVKTLVLSRNFGKESALVAGYKHCLGQAVISLDADGQHPAELIPRFYEKWKNGSEIVIGIRKSNLSESGIRNFSSRLFYKIFKLATGYSMEQSSTDYRLLDRSVLDELLNSIEPNMMTRAIVEWIGFNKSYIEFEAPKRDGGKSSYNLRSLVSLAARSIVSMSPRPLYISGMVGIFITFLATILGSTTIIEQFILNDPLGWKITGTAMIGILTMFLMGVVLMSQGVIALYISQINSQTKSRPLFILDRKKSSESFR